MKLWNKSPKERIDLNGNIIATIQGFEPAKSSLMINSISILYPREHDCMELSIYFQESATCQFFAELLSDNLSQSKTDDLIEVASVDKRAKVTFKNPELFNQIIADTISFFEEIDNDSRQEMFVEIKNLLSTPLQNVTTLQSLAKFLEAKQPSTHQTAQIEMQEFIKVAKGKGKAKEEMKFEFLESHSDEESYDEEMELAIAASLESTMPPIVKPETNETSSSSHCLSSSLNSSSMLSTTLATSDAGQGKGKEKETNYDSDLNNPSIRKVSIFQPLNSSNCNSKNEPNNANVLRKS